MKPTNSPTQGHPNPRKIRLKAAYLGHFFSTANIFSWVEVDFTQVPRKNRLKAAYLGHCFSTANIFSWVEVDFTHVGNTLQETSRDLILCKHPNDCRLIVYAKSSCWPLYCPPGSPTYYPWREVINAYVQNMYAHYPSREVMPGILLRTYEVCTRDRSIIRRSLQVRWVSRNRSQSWCFFSSIHYKLP